METNKVIVRKFFLIWEDEVEERWLEEMARKGLHLFSVSAFGRYTFEQSQPREMVYRLDYQEKGKQEMQDYYQLFKDAGWDYVGERSFWRYFCKPQVPDDVNEIFTDNRSKIAKYNRLMIFFLIPMVVACPILFINLYQFGNSFFLPPNTPNLYFLRLGILVALLLSIGFWLYGFFKLYFRIKKLKK